MGNANIGTETEEAMKRPAKQTGRQGGWRRQPDGGGRGRGTGRRQAGDSTEAGDAGDGDGDGDGDGGGDRSDGHGSEERTHGPDGSPAALPAGAAAPPRPPMPLELRDGHRLS